MTDVTYITEQQARDFVNLIRSMLINVNMRRIGAKTDGGYLIPADIKDINYCFSAGVGDTITFEEHLIDQYHTKCFLLDGGVSPCKQDELIEVDNLYLQQHNTRDTITLSSWMVSKQVPTYKNTILQMDIEGSEYQTILNEPIKVLQNFDVMIIEFHALNNIIYHDFWQMLMLFFHKLLPFFDIAHLHPNNCCGTIQRGWFELPNVLEITFVNKNLSLTHKRKQDLVLPNDNDYKNVPDKDDIIMPEIYWKKL
jgi:hypothetical protein